MTGDDPLAWDVVEVEVDGETYRIPDFINLDTNFDGIVDGQDSGVEPVVLETFDRMVGFALENPDSREAHILASAALIAGSRTTIYNAQGHETETLSFPGGYEDDRLDVTVSTAVPSHYEPNRTTLNLNPVQILEIASINEQTGRYSRLPVQDLIIHEFVHASDPLISIMPTTGMRDMHLASFLEFVDGDLPMDAFLTRQEENGIDYLYSSLPEDMLTTMRADSIAAYDSFTTELNETLARYVEEHGEAIDAFLALDPDMSGPELREAFMAATNANGDYVVSDPAFDMLLHLDRLSDILPLLPEGAIDIPADLQAIMDSPGLEEYFDDFYVRNDRPRHEYSLEYTLFSLLREQYAVEVTNEVVANLYEVPDYGRGLYSDTILVQTALDEEIAIETICQVEIDPLQLEDEMVTITDPDIDMETALEMANITDMLAGCDTGTVTDHTLSTGQNFDIAGNGRVPISLDDDHIMIP